MLRLTSHIPHRYMVLSVVSSPSLTRNHQQLQKIWHLPFIPGTTSKFPRYSKLPCSSVNHVSQVSCFSPGALRLYLVLSVTRPVPTTSLLGLPIYYLKLSSFPSSYARNRCALLTMTQALSLTKPQSIQSMTTHIWGPLLQDRSEGEAQSYYLLIFRQRV